jgi:hypothetical protein
MPTTCSRTTPILREAATGTQRSCVGREQETTAKPQPEQKELQMRPQMRPKILFTAFVGTLVLTAGQQGAQAQLVNLDTAAIEQATGLKGQLIPEENVFKLTKPRSDVKIAVDQWTMPPSWALAPGPRSRPLMVAQR